MKKFWIVVGTARNAIPIVLDEKENKEITEVEVISNRTVFDFPTEHQAVKVAECMAVKYPDEEYYIMESVKCSKAEIRAVTKQWSAGA
ncbi:hypothetical protein LCGC14_2386920 [marine sediment metagenome]|uniref:Uncharacterized protein n=1 Tax=marine sediment metagenome TaxID=412755 RepID=A0A0F9BZD1_9ZZZZ